MAYNLTLAVLPDTVLPRLGVTEPDRADTVQLGEVQYTGAVLAAQVGSSVLVLDFLAGRVAPDLFEPFGVAGTIVTFSSTADVYAIEQFGGQARARTQVEGEVVEDHGVPLPEEAHLVGAPDPQEGHHAPVSALLGVPLDEVLAGSFVLLAPAGDPRG